MCIAHIKHPRDTQIAHTRHTKNGWVPKMFIVFIKFIIWGQPGRFSEDMFVGNGCSRAWHWERLFFMLSCCYALFELISGHCKNSKTVMCFLPGFLSLKKYMPFLSKWRLVAAVRNGSTKKVRNDVFFWIPHQNRSTRKFLLLWPIYFCARETACEPKKTSFLRWNKLGSLGLRRISLMLRMAAETSENVMLRSL